QTRDLSSSVIATLPKGSSIQLGALEESGGQEWIEATLEEGRIGYVLGPSALGHTTPGATLSPISSIGKLPPRALSSAEPKDEKGWLIFRDRESALAENARWEELLPQRKSSYQPSGKMSPVAYFVLPTIGVAAGTLGAILAAAVVAFVWSYATSHNL